MSRRTNGSGKTPPVTRTNGVQPSVDPDRSHGLDAKEAAFPAPTPTPTARARFDVVALVTSAGGLEAVSKVLRDLPSDFPAAVVVAQHLGGQGSALVGILERRTKLPVEWASTGTRLVPGRVVVCPPRRQLEIMPDGACAVGGDITTREKPLDLLLESIADSCGPRALAVVLTGMGMDSAAGAAAVKRAGGVVLVQSEESAERPSMPRAAIARGASDLVLPLSEMAAVITHVVTGGQLPRPREEVEAAEALFAGEGEVRRVLRAIDWSHTTLGSLAQWPVSLRTTLRLVLDSPMAMCVLWGPDLIQLYNDQYRIVMGTNHPAGLGQPNRKFWPEVWHLNEPIYARVLAGESVALTDALYPITRRGTLEDAWFDLSFAPVRDDAGTVAGVLATIVETTARVLSQRRLRALQALTASSAGATSVQVAMERALEALAGKPGIRSDGTGVAHDLPYVLAYLRETADGWLQLAASFGVDAGGPMAPRTIDVSAGSPMWPLGRVLNAEAERPTLQLDDLAERFNTVPNGANGARPTSAMLLPLRPIADEPPTGVLICGINPRLVMDDSYRAFLDLVASHLSAGLAEARIRQRERERLERLAELDRVKTEFFSNISHEFRTPLTLLLAPLEELSRRNGQGKEPLAEEIQIAARNARRLLTQVNTLLDFSQVEANRLHPQFEPTDLAALTCDIVSVFRSAVDRAGLRLDVRCPTLPTPVWVDAQMWEKIVSNLLSNALKFTFTGEIVVELTTRARHAELTVRDTGVGIPVDEQPHVFKRFHRVRGRRGRTSEGSGIGLALVNELVRLHQGRVRVESVEDGGSTFTVWIPMGHRPLRDLSSQPAVAKTSGSPSPRSPEVATALAEEAARWTSDDSGADAKRTLPAGVTDDLIGPPDALVLPATSTARARILVVDDNADMRDYLHRLLKGQWDVLVAGDGTTALDALRRVHPDAVIADVMIPGLDGFELLAEIRRDVRLQYTPVVLVTARTGEQAAIDGLRAGADDYIAKPFSPRELIARVHAVVERSRVEAALRQSREDALRDLEDAKVVQRVSGRLIESGGEPFHEQILDAAIAITHADFGSIQLLDESRAQLHLLASRNFHPDSAEYWRTVSIATRSTCSSALQCGERVIVPDVSTADAKVLLGAGSIRHYALCGIAAVQSTPLVTRDGRLVGVFSTHWRHRHVPDQRQLLLLDILARQAADFFERRRTQEVLRVGEEGLRRMTGISGVGIVTFDAATGTLLDSNEPFLAMTGYARRQLERRELTWRSMTPPEYVEASELQMKHLAETGRIGPYEKEYFRADGSRSTMLFAGASLGDGRVVEYCVDVADRQRGDDARRAVGGQIRV